MISSIFPTRLRSIDGIVDDSSDGKFSKLVEESRVERAAAS
jgi:hypothetical protein